MSGRKLNSYACSVTSLLARQLRSTETQRVGQKVLASAVSSSPTSVQPRRCSDETGIWKQAKSRGQVPATQGKAEKISRSASQLGQHALSTKGREQNRCGETTAEARSTFKTSVLLFSRGSLLVWPALVVCRDTVPARVALPATGSFLTCMQHILSRIQSRCPCSVYGWNARSILASRVKTRFTTL